MSEQHGQLGVQVEYPRDYSPDVLHPIDRQQGRSELVHSQFVGHDLWNLWELSWLGENGIPVVATGQLFVPADSPFMVESKSLKLYLNSLNLTRFGSPQAFQECVEKDLSQCIGAPVSLSLKSSRDVNPQPAASQAKCIDSGELISQDFDSALANLIADAELSQEQHWESHVFRSLCPVTGQPDWASIDLRCVGPSVNPDALLSYLVAFREHGGFHEQCVERIWSDLMRFGQFTELEVLARFTRRGGIDICPYRSSSEESGVLWDRSRQRAFRQ